MAQTTYTFEEIDRRIEALDLADFQPGGRQHFTTEAVSAAPGQVLQKVCAIYRAVRPIIIGLENFPLLPKKWRDVIKTFRELMDGLCPGD